MFRSDKFLLFVDNELFNPTIFIFVKIFLMDLGKFFILIFLYICFYLLDDISKALSENMTMDEFFDIHTLDKDNDVRTFLKTRIQLLIRSLNITSLTRNDLIDHLLISENDILTEAYKKLELPF